MPIDHEIGRRLAENMIAIYTGLEERLAGAIALEVTRRPDPNDLEKLEAIRRMRDNSQRLLDRLDGDTRYEALAAITEAYVDGSRAALDDMVGTGVERRSSWLERRGLLGRLFARLLGITKRRDADRRTRITRELDDIRDKLPGVDAIQALAGELSNRMSSTHMQILRWQDDAYRQVVADRAVDVLAGTSTRLRASQVIWERLLEQGVTGFVDKSGRNWQLTSYVEMATRSTVMQATIEAHLARLKEMGQDLVQVSDAPQECKRCRPFEGKILSASGPAGRRTVEHYLTDEPIVITVTDTVAGAITKGLFHPNCRHRLVVYLPGVTKPLKDTADPQGDADRQHLRALEREVRKNKRLAAGALTREARLGAEEKVRDFQERIRDHVANTTAKRQRHREQIPDEGHGRIIDPPAPEPRPTPPLSREPERPQPTEPPPAPEPPAALDDGWVIPDAPRVGDLIPPDGYQYDIDDKNRAKAAAKRALDREFAGFKTEVATVGISGNHIDLYGHVLDADGGEAGKFHRTLNRDTDGTLWVEHAFLQLDARHQGQGFAKAFNNHLYDWYRESGVDHVKVHANIDVGGYCVPMRARILTRQGWKKHDEVTTSDETLGYDFATDTMRWTPVTAIATFDSLPMRRLEHRNWAVEATPNHRWIVRRFAAPQRKATWLAPEFLTTDELAKAGRRIIVSAPLDQAEPDRSTLTPDEAALLAWLVTDGNVHQRLRHGRNHIEVTAAIAQEKPEGREALRSLIGRFGGRMTPRGCNVPAAALRGLYVKLGVPYGERLKPHLHATVLRMGAAQLDAFCEAGMLAEGDHNRARFWQKPGDVLEAFQLAFFLTGHRVSGGVRDGDLAWATISRPHVTSEKLRITDIGNEPAWCPQTGLGTWVMELDGHVMLTGNTWAREGFDFEDESSADEVLTGLRDFKQQYEDELGDRRRHLELSLPDAEEARTRADVARLETGIAAAQAILDRADNNLFGADDYPTAYEMSQAGRTAGADTWIGKEATLDTSWYGVRWMR